MFEVILWDFDRVGASDHLGTVIVPLNDLVAGPVDKWYALGQKRGKNKDKEEIKGDVHLVFKYNALPKDESKANKEHGTNEILSMVEEIQKAIQQKLEETEEQLKQAQEFVSEIDNIFLKDYFTYCKPQKLADLTVHVVEARGLTKKDIIGSSDPYVVVSLEGQEQKTEVIKNNLNPKWKDGRFSFGVTRLSSNLTFTLYDWDATGSDDFLGYVSLPITGTAGTSVVEGTEAGKKKLDLWLTLGHRPTDPDDVTGELHLVVEFAPAQASDEQPNKAVRETTEVIQMVQSVREAYQTQIAKANEEAKQATEFVSTVDALFTPEYYEWCKPAAIAELNVQVVEAKELIKADIIGSSDPYVVLEIENQKAQTTVIKKTVNPKWDKQFFSLPITKLTGSLFVHVFDHDVVGKNESLGSASVSVRDILSQTLEGQQPYSVVLPLSWQDKKNKKPITGSVSITINFRPIKGEEIKKEGQAYQKEVEERATAVKNELVKRARESGAIFGKILHRIERERPFATAPIPEGTLTISITGARGLLAADIVSGTSDPYCVIKVGKVEHKTPVVKNTLAPQWNVNYTIPIIKTSTAILEVTVFDHDLIGRDDFLGYINMPVSLFEEGHPNSGWFKLQPYKKYKAKGEVFMEITFSSQNKENLLIDFEAEPALPEGVAPPEIADPAVVVQALDEVFKAYEEKVKALEAALKGEKFEKERAASKAQSLAAKLTSTFVGK